MERGLVFEEGSTSLLSFRALRKEIERRKIGRLRADSPRTSIAVGGGTSKLNSARVPPPWPLRHEDGKGSVYGKNAPKESGGKTERGKKIRRVSRGTWAKGARDAYSKDRKGTTSGEKK